MQNQISQNKIAASDASFRDQKNSFEVSNLAKQGALTNAQARNYLEDAIVKNRTRESRISQVANDANTSFWNSRKVETDAKDANQRFTENMRQGYYALQTANQLENMKLINANLAIDEKTKNKNYQWIDKTNQQLWNEMQSNIAKNYSDINRNNHLNNLTDNQSKLVISQKKAQDLENLVNGDPNVQDAKKMKEIISSAPSSVSQAIFADPWYKRYVKCIQRGDEIPYEVSWNMKRLFELYGLMSGNPVSALGVTGANFTHVTRVC